MSNFITELWESIFTPGPTPTLLIATNATFASLQIVFLILLLATYSIHFIILSFLCAGLWYSINWFASELSRAQKEDHQQGKPRTKKERSPDPTGGSDTETETMSPSQSQQLPSSKSTLPQQEQGTSTSFLKPGHDRPDDIADSTSHRRRSLGDSSGYISTDSEWEKISSGEEKHS